MRRAQEVVGLSTLRAFRDGFWRRVRFQRLRYYHSWYTRPHLRNEIDLSICTYNSNRHLGMNSKTISSRESEEHYAASSKCAKGRSSAQKMEHGYLGRRTGTEVSRCYRVCCQQQVVSRNLFLSVLLDANRCSILRLDSIKTVKVVQV